MDQIAPLALRAGLGLVFLIVGVQKLGAPHEWARYLPSAALEQLHLDAAQFLLSMAVCELLIGALLLLGLFTRGVAILAAVLLAGVILSIQDTHAIVRDLGLLAAAVALAGTGTGRFGLDRLLESSAASGSMGSWRLAIPALLPLASLLAGFAAQYGGSSNTAYLTRVEVEAEYAHLTIPPLPREHRLDPRKVTLGASLFADTRLSSDRTISCKSCHKPGTGGADARRESVGVGGQLGAINSPTVLNAGFNSHQFWDGRVETLAEQVRHPLENPAEMGADWGTVIPRLQQDPYYRGEFPRLYEDGLTPENVADAIATFEHSLLTPDAPFDRYIRGDEQALNPEAREGYDLFLSLGCVTCHQGVNVGGNVFQRIGTMHDFFQGRAVTEKDLGRYNVTGRERDRFVFKVPGLRNVAHTAPYFHDGSAATLEEAVERMAYHQLGFHLEDVETAALVAFLESLSGDLPAHFEP